MRPTPTYKLIVVLAVVALCTPGRLWAQVGVSNKNTTIEVKNGAIFYIPGSYTDFSDGGDGRLTITGEVVLGGNLHNNGTTSLINSVGG